MKILTANFLTCAVKSCKTSAKSFPLHFRDAELEHVDMEFNPLFLTNLLPRIEWDALRSTAGELGMGAKVPESKPEFPRVESAVASTMASTATASEDEDMSMDETIENPEFGAGSGSGSGHGNGNGADATPAASLTADQEHMLRELHRVLLETQVVEGKMVCGNCGFEYKIKEGITNFLLPSHLV